MRFWPIFSLVSVFAATTANRISYDGYKAVSISVQGSHEEIKETLSSLDYVTLGCGGEHPDHFDVAIAPGSLPAFEALGLNATSISEDLGTEFASESAFEAYLGSKAELLNSDSTTIALPNISWFNSYHSYADHRLFFDDLRAAIPGNSEIFTVGKSYEGRDIYGFHFWGESGKGRMPAIYFHATVHAREWIAAPVVEYLAWELISGYLGNDDEVKQLVDRYDFYIIPFVNPDGFYYTQTKDRLWRKTRQPRSGTRCIGTDGNRNWPFKWDAPYGASTDPCTETYKGEAAGDTPEVSAIIPFTKRLSDSNGIKLFIDFHSFGQYILLPYGYDCNAVAVNNKTQMMVAGGMAQRIFDVNGTEYIYGPSCQTLYASTGTAPDYMAGEAGAEYAWTIELRPPTHGADAFVLPPSLILSTVQEQWEGVKYVLKSI